MNLAVAYAIFERTNVLLRCGKSAEEIINDLYRRYPAVRGKSLDAILEEVSSRLAA